MIEIAECFGLMPLSEQGPPQRFSAGLIWFQKDLAKGRDETWRFLRTFPQRDHFVRRALSGESYDGQLLYSKKGIVATQRVCRGGSLIIQRILRVTEALAKGADDDHGEEAAQQMFELAETHSGLQYEELFTVQADGLPVIVGSREVKR